MGIRHIGQENAKLLAQYFQTKVNFCKMSENFNFSLLSNIDGIGETQINSIKKFFLDQININVVQQLVYEMNIRDSKQSNEGKLKNKTFMFTGKLTKVSRAEAKSLTEQNSGKILSNVTKNLDYLVIGEKPTTKKIKQANELNVKIIKQSEWEDLLN